MGSLGGCQNGREREQNSFLEQRVSVCSVQAVGTISTVREKAGSHILDLIKIINWVCFSSCGGWFVGRHPYASWKRMYLFWMLPNTTGHIYSRSAQEKENYFPLRCIFDSLSTILKWGSTFCKSCAFCKAPVGAWCSPKT